MLHICRSPFSQAVSTRSIRSASSRSVLARRARRFTKMLVGSMQLRMLARLLGQSGGLHLHSIWNQISTGVAAVLPSKAVFSSAPKFF
jgi:hypothetical protein